MVGRATTSRRGSRDTPSQFGSRDSPPHGIGQFPCGPISRETAGRGHVASASVRAGGTSGLADDWVAGALGLLAVAGRVPRARLDCLAQSSIPRDVGRRSRASVESGGCGQQRRHAGDAGCGCGGGAAWSTRRACRGLRPRAGTSRDAAAVVGGHTPAAGDALAGHCPERG